jgi:molybdate transport system ATP-binding protein
MNAPGHNTPFLTAELLTLSAGSRTLVWDLNFTMGKREHWILTGPAGVGKSTLGKALCGLVFHRGVLQAPSRVLFVDQWHHFKDRTGLSSRFYYQQRYHSQDSENAVTLLEELLGAGGSEAEAWKLLRALHVDQRANASLVQLSSGEHKKLQLARAFLTSPELLVLDNPYLGLDAETCAGLDDLFTAVAAGGTQLIIIGDTAKVPSVITHIATLSADALAIVPRAAYQLIHQGPSGLPLPALALPVCLDPAPSFEHFLRMESMRIQYGDKTVLDDITWTVKRGERWWIKGHNGAGKSTLLSLVVGDNPQAYANTLYLFDRRRGSGESIWDIKRKIGYISPELHWYFDQETTCEGAIATGFFDTTGLYRVITPEQQALVDQWLEVFDLCDVRDRRLQELSIGRQRMALLARALVKNPPVLILDEACQGLDEQQATHFLRVVDRIMEQPGRTLLYVSHRLDQLPLCIDHVLALAEGRQTEQGTYHHKIKPYNANTSL